MNPINLTPPKNLMCIYHKNCLDGFGAALVVYLWAKKHHQECEFIPAIYGDAPPNAIDKNLLIVDFSYPRDALLTLKEQTNTITVIDHHKTAQEALKGLDFCIFDMSKCGAVLTWEYFYPKTDTPLLLQYIQDRDLWRWELHMSHEVSAGLLTLERNFDEWEHFFFKKGQAEQDEINNLTFLGMPILIYQKKQIQKAVKSDIPLQNIAGHQVPCINTTHLISEIGNEISQGHPFAAMYFETANERVYSLRSSSNGIDVSAIAKQFGGGGHFHAAAFTVAKPAITIMPTPC